MSQSKHAVELCALLVDEIFGELTSRIFTILSRRGRLPIQSLAQHTRLTKRQVRHGLVVLIQQNLIYYYEDGQDGCHGTYYEANPDAAYGLVRVGKILELVESRCGVLGQDLVQNIFLLGHTRVCELTDIYNVNEQSAVNGDCDEIVATEHSIPVAKAPDRPCRDATFMLYYLLEAGFIEPVTKTMFRSPADRRNEVEKSLLGTDEFKGGIRGTKQKESLQNKIRENLESLRSTGQDWKLKGNKRALNGAFVNGTNRNAKRRKLLNGNIKHEDEEVQLERNLILRINYDKCTVALRSLRLAELAYSRIGETTSYVYAELLRLLEEGIQRCRPDTEIDDLDDLPDGPTVTTVELAAAVNNSIDVATGIGKVKVEKIDTSNLLNQRTKKRKVGNDSEVEVEGEASSDEYESDNGVHETNHNTNMLVMDANIGSEGGPPVEVCDMKDPKRPRVTFQDRSPNPAEPDERLNHVLQIKNHLMLLAADECHFLRRCGNRGHGEWTVDFERLVDYLQQSELDFIILENFDVAGHRLARMMRKVGKVDEKQLSSIALMKQKDIRTKLAEMQMAGMVDIQEVPKDSNRTNARTIFLWYFDAARVSSIILQNVYKTMSRCLQRLEIERRRSDDILSLSERSDVKDNKEEILKEEHLNQLRVFHGKEDKLLGQLGRLDELVSIFRDY